MVSPEFPTFKHFDVSFQAEYVAHVQINRPEKMNAFFESMWFELSRVFTFLSTNPSVRAIILSGAGPKAFTTGLDVQAASSSGTLTSAVNQDPARKAVQNRRHIDEFQACISTIEECEKPVICVMHGFTLGLGIDIATCCDIRICSNDTKFAVKEVDIGLAADIGTLSRLPKVVGNASWVKDVCLSARFFGPEEAYRVGFVSRVEESKQAAVDFASKWASLVAEKSPVAVQGTKEILNYSRDHTVKDGLRYTSVWNSAALQTSDVGNAMQAGTKKSRATFEKL
ncbi:hypothetical protein MMC25_001377 [Agyrium rufum]|nr:hypothetical protein [Agyrium rufum]